MSNFVGGSVLADCDPLLRRTHAKQMIIDVPIEGARR